jgi:hypothetical protein
VDEGMRGWGGVAEPGLPVMSITRTADGVTRRPTRVIDLDLLGDDLTTTIGLLAEDLAIANR